MAKIIKTKKIKVSNVTLDDLAGMMKRGFDEVYHRMDARFESLTNEMNGRFEQIEHRIYSIEQILKDHSVILDVHTEQLRDIHRTLDMMAETDSKNTKEIKILQARVQKIEIKMGLVCV